MNKESLTTTPHAEAEPPADEHRWRSDFADWLEREMPEGTVIGDPRWWASSIADYLVHKPIPAPPAAITFPYISDKLIRMLICDILSILTESTEKALNRCQFDPIPEVRARLTEILQMAAQDQA